MRFSREWSEEKHEEAEAKTFWDGFFDVFGITRRRVASFEEPVKRRREGGKTATGYIDLLWKGKLLVEHKSRGKDLDRAYAQAVDYFPGIPERDLPRYIIVSDFARFRLHDLETDQRSDFSLEDIHKNIGLFGFISGYETRALRPQDPVNLKAAERMGRLHDALKDAGYDGHPLEVLLVRLLFCLFADATGIFQPAQSFRDFLEIATEESGRDLGRLLTELFQTLNAPEGKRQKNLDAQLAAFPYVNGKLFGEMLPIPVFDRTMRESLLDACALDWGRISPAIFGALFQSIMDEGKRRNLGAHYTSETNILKLIEPLFLDGLRAEFEAARRNERKLRELQSRLRSLTFFDPACGCGNFLVVAYRELRQLEFEILQVLAGNNRVLDISPLLQVNVDQFFGIEIEEFPAQVAQVAMWLTDHQMNLRVGLEFGQYYARLPLTTSATILHANALAVDWEQILPAGRLRYILGNPPFVGKKEQTPSQKADLLRVFGGGRGANVLDYVTGWYFKAAAVLEGHPEIACAFVSTSSITQGEQPCALWPKLWKRGMNIYFAHRTFRWTNEGRGVAAVHCVIIAFGCAPPPERTLFDYEDVNGEPRAIAAANINPYLVDAADVVLPNRGSTISPVPPIAFGSMPNDGGNLLLSDDEKKKLLEAEPGAAKWIRRYMSSKEFIHDIPRWCLWLIGMSAAELRALPAVAERVAAVKEHRQGSTRPETVALAALPTLFGENRQPKGRYVAVPKTSSERREYIPIGYLPPQVIANTEIFTVSDGGDYHLGILCSKMHMAWVRNVCGRLESRYRYSAGIVYNNFPWPKAPTERQKQAIETAAQQVIAARSEFPKNSLADLYDPVAMPPALTKAHRQLDRAVDLAFAFKGNGSDSERVAFLFRLYHGYTSLFPLEKADPKPKRRRS